MIEARTDTAVSLTLPAKAEYLLLTRLALAGISRTVPIDEESLADLKLAVTEACANAVNHAYADGQGTVRVTFRLLQDEVEIVVADDGPGVPTDRLPTLPADPEVPVTPAESGMGLAIVNAIMDEVTVEPGPGGRGTTLVMRKRLPG